MAIQYPCDVCGELENEVSLTGIHGKLMCSCCVKQHIACLEAKIWRLEEENDDLQRQVNYLKKN